MRLKTPESGWRMCPEVIAYTDLKDRYRHFLQLSNADPDALLGVSTDEAVHSLPLSAALSSALTSHSGPIGRVLQSVTAFEQGQWDGIQAEGFDIARLQGAYVEAVRWAEDSRALLAP